MSTLWIDQAFTQAIIDAGIELDLVFDNGGIYDWDGTSYTGRLGTYSPETGRAYAACSLKPNRVDAFTVADQNETSGIYQVILYFPQNSGDIPAKMKAEQVMESLSIGTRVTQNGKSATITSVQRQPGVPEDGWFKIVVSIRYQAFMKR